MSGNALGGYSSGPSHQIVGPSQRQLIPPPVCGAMAPPYSSVSSSSSSGPLWPQRSIQTYHPSAQPFSNYPIMHHHSHSNSVPHTGFGDTPYLSSAGPGASIAIGPGTTMATAQGASMATGPRAAMVTVPGASMAHHTYSSSQGSSSGYMPFQRHGNSVHPQASTPGIVMNGTSSQNVHRFGYPTTNTSYPSSPFSSIISLLDSDESDDNAANALTNNSVDYGYTTTPSSQLPMDQGVSGCTAGQEPLLSGAENGLSQSEFNKILEMFPSESDLQ